MISIILAGGAGTRLWPLSRKFWPKFLLKLGSDKYSLLQQTFLRVKEFTSIDKIFVVVNKEHKFLVKENIQDLGLNFPLDNIIVEPEIKNTLPAITLACKVIKSRFTEREIVGVFPSDHIIKPEKTFKDFILKAGKVAESGYIVLFGVKPNRVETGYGHIKLNTSQKLKIKHFKGVYFVEKFIEKPSFATANKLISSNSVYWNSGIFVFSINCFFDELKIYQQKMYQIFENCDLKEESLKKVYKNVENVSIDKGLIEKTEKLVVMPVETIFWDDLGSFTALERVYDKDDNQNILLAKNVDVDSKNIIVVGNNRLIATCGVKNLIIVDTEDAILVVDKKYDQKVRDIVSKIKDETVLYHKTVQRPWGFYSVLKHTGEYKLKVINVLPKKRLSLQKHLKRTEQWFVVSGIAKVICGNKVVYLKKGQTLEIPRNIPHRLENPSKTKTLEIIEVAYGKYLAEDDIIRLEDDFGRR